MGKVIIVTSGKGGTGKTTAVGAISSCLAALGHKTLCLDCDVGLKNLDIVLGMSDRAIIDFGDVLEGRSTLDEAAVVCPDIENLAFLTSPMSARAEELDKEKMRALTDEIREKYEYCIIDSPAGLGSGFRLAAAGADSAVIVVTGDTSSMRDGQKAASELEKLGINETRLVVNRLSPGVLKASGLNVDDFIDAVGSRLLGLVSEDKTVQVAANKGRPLVLYSDRKAAEQFLRIARRLTGENVPLGRI